MGFIKKIGLLFLSIVLLSLAWPPFVLGPIIFVAFIPLLFFVDNIFVKQLWKKYLIALTGIFTVLYLFAVLISYQAWGDYNNNIHMAIFMCFVPTSIVVSLYSIFRNKVLGLLFLIFSWGCMEILQMNWELNSPLLMLGNSLSLFPSLIQHYSVWGMLGGAMYILSINVLGFLIVKKIISREKLKKELILLSVLFVPTIISLLTFSIPEEKNKAVKIGIALAHFEHFTEENSLNTMLLVNRYNKMIRKNNIEDLDLMVFSESTIVNGGWIENLNNDSIPNPLDSLCPGKEILFGSHLFSIHEQVDDELPYYVRYDANSKVNFESHNCVVFRSELGNYSVRSKEKYVGFHEVVPYPDFLMFTKKWYDKAAVPTYLSKYKKSNIKPFKTINGTNIFGLMCFESFFSNMIIKQSDANIIFVLANESWNYQTRGKEQYFDYMIPKAIEAGKGIVKVSNCGYSGYIDSKGTIVKKIDFNKPQIIKIDINPINTASIYSSIGTGINYLTVTIAMLLFTLNIIKK